MAVLGLTYGRFEARHRNRSGDVDDGSPKRGDRDPISDGDLMRPKSLAMTAHPLRRPGRPGRGDFDGSRSLVARYSPESRRRSMTHGRSETTDEHGCQPSPLSGHLPVTHHVHTGMEPVEQPVPYAAGDRLPSKPQLEELVAGHHAVLPPRQFSNHRVCPLSLRLYVLGTCKRRLAGHWTMVPAAASRVARGLWMFWGDCAPGPGTVLALISMGPGCARRRPRQSPPRPRGSRRPRGRSTAPERRRGPRPRGCRWRRPGRWPDARRRAASR